jgi:hypothetical protein
MLEPDPTQPFYLIVTDNDRGVFSVEGPMTDDRPWNAAARYARDQHQRRNQTGTRWRPSIAARTSWPAFRREAS